jgi:seryl-tRNA(Sec) selenium transferase
MRWARDCGFVGAIKKAEVIEIAEAINVPNVSKFDARKAKGG